MLPFLLAAQTEKTPDPAVQAILFYSPTCPHCHQVINEFLIPMQEEYGDRLQLIGIDTSDPAGSALYGNMVEHFEIPQDRWVVPILVVGDMIMVGGADIPDRFPGIVEEGLSAGGIGWPDIPDLTTIVPDLPPSADPSQVSEPAEVETENEAAATPEPSALSLEEAGRETSAAEAMEDPPADPAGFALAWIVLAGMVAALAYALYRIISSRPTLALSMAQPASDSSTWLVPLLALLGLGVAAYLAYVEMTQVKAVCGPIGECNIVQSSPYAQLFGVPIAVWGLLSYLAILALWAGRQLLSGTLVTWCSRGLVLLTGFGTLFSIYLTLLELFAIKAVCLWCLSSAVLTTVIMLLVVRSVTVPRPQVSLGSQVVDSQ